VSTAAQLRARLRASPPTLEALLTSPRYFGLETATPVQRAVCRASDGIPLGELASHPDVIEAFGGEEAVASLPPFIETMLLLAAIRSAKSMIAAAAIIRQSQRVGVSKLSVSDPDPRVSCLSIQRDLAAAVYRHLANAVSAKPALRELLLSDPTSERVVLRHPSGRPIEVMIVAGAAAGATLMSRWSAGIIFDEAPQMVGSGDGAISLDDMRTATDGRMLPGAMKWELGSPWAPFGPVYDSVAEFEGKPSKKMVVVRATGPQMNPSHWTPEYCEELRVKNPLAYQTNCQARFASPEENLISEAVLLKCTARGYLVEERRARHEYVAAIDPATRGNAWTVAIGTRREGRRIIVKLRQWTGSSADPLDPERVLSEMADELAVYGVDAVETDQWSGDALAALARLQRIRLVQWPMTASETVEAYKDVALWMTNGQVELPNDPVARTDMLRIKKRVTQTGLAIVLPKTSDGRHCDYAPAIMRCLRRACGEPPRSDSPENRLLQAEKEQAETLERVKARYAPKETRRPWRGPRG
jgi:hypothetical protein